MERLGERKSGSDPVELQALANKDRLGILFNLRAGASNAASLSASLALPKNSINYHLKVLEKAGLIRRAESRTGRGGTQSWWALASDGFSGHDGEAGLSARPIFLRAMAAQMAEASSRRLLAGQFTLDADAREKAETILEQAIKAVQGLETEDGETTTVTAFMFSEGRTKDEQ
jgi:predicted ArsR family transcriptional regulator